MTSKTGDLPAYGKRSTGLKHGSQLSLIEESVWGEVLRRYFETSEEPRNRIQGIDSAILCSLAGRYDKPYSYSDLTTSFEPEFAGI
jgi:hypothetical protein